MELLGVEIDVWLQHRLFIVETLMFNLHKNDHLLSLNKLETMSHLDVALKVSNIALYVALKVTSVALDVALKENNIILDVAPKVSNVAP